MELYSLQGADAKDFLGYLAKEERWRTSDDDERAALTLLPDQDKNLSKTRTLALHAAARHDGRFAGGLQPFFVDAVRPEFDEVDQWPPAPEGGSGEEIFRAIVESHAQKLAEREPPKRLFNAVMIAQSLLTARYGLDVQSAVPVLADALGPPNEARRTRVKPRALRLRAIGDTRLTTEALRTWLDVLSPWIRRAVDAERVAAEAEADVTRYREIVADLEHELEVSTQDRERLADEVRELRSDLDATADRARGATLAKEHHDVQLRGSAAGFLADDLLPLLQAAREALELDPPRWQYTHEKLEDITHIIEERLKWLRS